MEHDAIPRFRENVTGFAILCHRSALNEGDKGAISKQGIKKLLRYFVKSVIFVSNMFNEIMPETTKEQS